MALQTRLIEDIQAEIDAAIGGSNSNIQFQDEGSNLGTTGTADTVNFTGAGVTASRASNTVTVNIPGGGGGVSDGDKGDITVSGGGTTWTVDNDAITYAKIQNVSATDKLLGRSTAGAGDIEEIALTAAGRALIDDATASDQRTTLGLGTLATQNGTFSGSSSGTNTGDQTITLTTDVTGSGTGSFATTIAAGAVTLAKMANMATSSVFYRKTAGSGAPEVQTLATLKTDLGLTGTNSGDQTITLTGDVTGSGTGSFAATIANDAVTNVKLANMAASTIKGNNTGGAADPVDMTVAQTKTLLAYTAADVGAAATSHTHSAADITSGTMATARLGSGTANSTTFLRGDQTYATVTASVSAPFVGNIATGSFTIGTDQFGIQGNELKLVSTDEATLQGTGSLSILT